METVISALKEAQELVGELEEKVKRELDGDIDPYYEDQIAMIRQALQLAQERLGY